MSQIQSAINRPSNKDTNRRTGIDEYIRQQKQKFNDRSSNNLSSSVILNSHLDAANSGPFNPNMGSTHNTPNNNNNHSSKNKQNDTKGQARVRMGTYNDYKQLKQLHNSIGSSNKYSQSINLYTKNNTRRSIGQIINNVNASTYGKNMQFGGGICNNKEIRANRDDKEKGSYIGLRNENYDTVATRRSSIGCIYTKQNRALVPDTHLGRHQPMNRNSTPLSQEHLQTANPRKTPTNNPNPMEQLPTQSKYSRHQHPQIPHQHQHEHINKNNTSDMYQPNIYTYTTNNNNNNNNSNNSVVDGYKQFTLANTPKYSERNTQVNGYGKIEQAMANKVQADADTHTSINGTRKINRDIYEDTLRQIKAIRNKGANQANQIHMGWNRHKDVQQYKHKEAKYDEKASGYMDCLPFRYNDASYKHKLESAVNLDLRENRAWRADRDSSSRLPSNTHNNSYTYHPDIPTAVPTTLKQPMNKSAIISAIPASTRPVPPSMSNKHNNSYEKIEIDLDGLSSRQQYQVIREHRRDSVNAGAIDRQQYYGNANRKHKLSNNVNMDINYMEGIDNNKRVSSNKTNVGGHGNKQGDIYSKLAQYQKFYNEKHSKYAGFVNLEPGQQASHNKPYIDRHSSQKYKQHRPQYLPEMQTNKRQTSNLSITPFNQQPNGIPQPDQHYAYRMQQHPPPNQPQQNNTLINRHKTQYLHTVNNRRCITPDYRTNKLTQQPIEIKNRNRNISEQNSFDYSRLDGYITCAQARTSGYDRAYPGAYGQATYDGNVKGQADNLCDKQDRASRNYDRNDRKQKIQQYQKVFNNQLINYNTNSYPTGTTGNLKNKDNTDNYRQAYQCRQTQYRTDIYRQTTNSHPSKKFDSNNNIGSYQKQDRQYPPAHITHSISNRNAQVCEKSTGYPEQDSCFNRISKITARINQKVNSMRP